ncbi:MAG: hypothetical protein GTN99_06205 [Candidatus Dadabacteria bacterium]|nr:hypothetical protein [Candidatus Dadabacteria bacterium]NIT13828.1 hypothetical protein [Candidatus Dadabacteria bacterium]
MSKNFQNHVSTSGFPTDNPLFQLVSDSPQNNLMFFTQMNEDWTRGCGNYCCICGTYEFHMIAIDPRLQKSMCLGCYNMKIKLDTQIDKMLKPYRLTEDIFVEKHAEPAPTMNVIPISQPVGNNVFCY